MIELIVSSILTAILLAIGLSVIIFLLKKRNCFPYSNVSSKWVLILLTSVLINQINYLIMLFTNYFEFNRTLMIVKIINSTILHYFIGYPLIVRAYLLSLTVKYNYYHLSEKNYDYDHQRKAHLLFIKQYYSNQRDYYIMKLVFGPLCVLVIIVTVLMYFKDTRCFLYFFAVYGNIDPKECEVKKNVLLFGSIIDTVLFNIEIAIFLTFIFNVFKYKINSDKFNIQLEIFILFLIWAFYHNLFHGIMIIYYELEIKYLFFINNFQNYCFIFLYIYLIYTRMKIDKNEFLQILKNFDMFMNNHFCFSFYKEYIKNYEQDYYKYFSFWVDYSIYKLQILNYSSNQNKTIDIQLIRNNALIIYQDYFCHTSVSLNSLSEKIGTLSIDFPVDINEYVEDVCNSNCYLDFKILNELYDEAFLFVYDKLYNLYLIMCRRKDIYSKLEEMVSFIDITEVKSQNIIRKKTISNYYH